MPAPTALLQPEVAPEDVPLPDAGEDDVLITPTAEIPAKLEIVQPAANAEDVDMTTVDEESRPKFPPGKDTIIRRSEIRKIPIPPHRVTPLKSQWSKVYSPLVEHCRLQVRFNIRTKSVELRTSKHTESTAAIQKGADFVQAFAYGFDVDDAIALLRMDSLYIQTFEIKDIRTLNPEANSRAIGRIAGKDGKMKFSIENATKTRIVLADSKVHILGDFKNIGMARESITSLILGRTPGKVYNNLRTISSRMKERF
ncbi:hypothetical protein P8C59_006751 [Phyllachora maydis]|uniref:Pre-rRNA-processing protein PNO1 n=1 Tax=Phyllachora maydis TaxID=1825666 RepID=A0AAD9I6Y3_9PEZI|nr:hypothetical protein P8C59_006751 [Phyllachora maydis]